MGFIDGFNKIIPYYLSVNVGKNRHFKTDPNAKSLANYKGKLVSFRKRSTTIEELKKFGYGEYETFLPADQVSMPIDIEVNSNKKINPIIERTSKFTNKDATHHIVRVLDDNSNQIGFVSFTLTPSGDFHDRTSFYVSPDMSERIRHSSLTDMENGEIIKDDAYEFQKVEDSSLKTVGINQRNGKIVACSIAEQDLDRLLNYSSPNCECAINVKQYLATCVFDEPDYKKRGGYLIPWECMILEEDLLSYQHKKDRFAEGLEIVKEKTGIDLNCSSPDETYEKIIELSTYSTQMLNNNGLHNVKTNINLLAKLAKYLKCDDNNLLNSFKGSYIGNIVRITTSGYTACIVTKHRKDKKDYKLYSLVDLSGTSISQGTGDEEFQGIRRDKYYFDRLKSASAVPTFVTEIAEDGSEKLVLHEGDMVFDKCPEYERFLKDFIEPFEEIHPISINSVLNTNKKKGKYIEDDNEDRERA